ncbi:MerR family transcriptional regulator [Labrys portucalensis]|uniref:MerR family transcriptional regulator n=1 Tax=Labrys neptuniae TaxID=376174 RepID=A0ABV6ZCV1_9HYPH
MKIGELARRSGLSVHTLRYYEKVGLLPPAFRNGSGQRDYDAAILGWIDFLGRMKAADMPLRDIAAYARLWKQGAGTEAARRDLLEKQRRRVAARIEDLQSGLLVIEQKILDLVELEKGRQS